MDEVAASRIQSHADRTGRNLDFKARATSSASKNKIWIFEQSVLEFSGEEKVLILIVKLHAQCVLLKKYY